MHDGITDIRKAGLKRLADACHLLEDPTNEHARGAAYLAGYAIECRLKAVAMEIHGCRNLRELAVKWDIELRDLHTHNLDSLGERLRAWNQANSDPELRIACGIVRQWQTNWRYNPHNWETEKAQEFINAVRRLLRWFDANRF